MPIIFTRKTDLPWRNTLRSLQVAAWAQALANDVSVRLGRTTKEEVLRKAKAEVLAVSLSSKL
eukprot:SAG31_NODE_664_length_12996_cov_4.853997_10_plen_63_part_00